MLNPTLIIRYPSKIRQSEERIPRIEDTAVDPVEPPASSVPRKNSIADAPPARRDAPPRTDPYAIHLVESMSPSPETVDWRFLEFALLYAMSRFDPQVLQNLELSLFSVPQLGHVLVIVSALTMPISLNKIFSCKKARVIIFNM